MMGLTWGQEEADRIAERIDRGVDLGAQPAFPAPDGLILTVFLRLPRYADERARWC